MASSERSMRKAIFVKVLEKKAPKHPRKHASSKTATANLTLHVCTLKYQCNSLKCTQQCRTALTVFSAQATTAAQHLPYFPLLYNKRNSRPEAKLKHWCVILSCTDREARLVRRFWSRLCWVVSPVSRFLIAPLPAVQGPEVQDTKWDFTGRQTSLCWLGFSTRHHTVMLNKFVLAWALLQNSSRLKIQVGSD